MDNNTQPSDIAALLTEMDRLRRSLAGRESFGPVAHAALPEEELRLVARFVSGLTRGQYEQMIDATRDRGWFSIPLRPDEYPGMNSLFQLANSLNGDICPITGALSSAAFGRHLREKLRRAVRHHEDLAMIALDIALAPSGQSGRTPGPETADDVAMLALAQAAGLEMGGGETLGHLDRDHLAIMAPGARQLKVRSLAERVLDQFAAAQPFTAPESSIRAARAGIACFNPDDPQTDPAKIADSLRTQAIAALETAPPNQARVFQRDTRSMAERTVLVQTGEKHFLFFGDMEQS
jgi:GGDEF domain-containing protein